MALLNPGYWQSTYWPNAYWQQELFYWPEYGTRIFYETIVRKRLFLDDSAFVDQIILDESPFVKKLILE